MTNKKLNVKYVGNVIEDTAYDEIKKKLKEKGQSEEEASEGAGKILSASSKKEGQKSEAKKDDSPRIKSFYSEGEYLSGHMPNADKETLERLEKLGIIKYIQGWGTRIDPKLIETLGEEFTLAQAEAYAKPLLEAKAKKAEEQKQKNKSFETEKFAEAKRTGKPVILKQWSEECNDPREECNVDNITLYAMPDGSTKRTRSHTW